MAAVPVLAALRIVVVQALVLGILIGEDVVDIQARHGQYMLRSLMIL